MQSELICGVDEAGRGPIAGPVCAAAVILRAGESIAGLADSKKLGAGVRARLRSEIEARALAWSIAMASVEEIEELNILGATLLAMRRAVQGLSTTPTQVLVDGLHCPQVATPVRAIVRGDALEPAISAASILAKTERDQAMVELHGTYPQYGFDIHKGYPTRAHLAALRRHGACAAHRIGFAPVREILRSIPR